jgi:hypothetical protein
VADISAKPKADSTIKRTPMGIIELSEFGMLLLVYCGRSHFSTLNWQKDQQLENKALHLHEPR